MPARNRPSRRRRSRKPGAGRPTTNQRPTTHNSNHGSNHGSNHSSNHGGQSVKAGRKPATALDAALALAASAPQRSVAFTDLGLSQQVIDVLARSGITRPTPIQASALPDALAGRDVLGRAQTGSGKTLAFGLPMLTTLAANRNPNARGPRGLVLLPTRELADQVGRVLVPIARALSLHVVTVVGGASIGTQIAQLRRRPDIVVATPGRLIDLLDRRVADLSDVSVAVLDEADHMADLGFLPAVTRILDATPSTRQCLLFSATLDRGVDRLVARYLSDPAIHAVAPAEGSEHAMTHEVWTLDRADKVEVASEIARRPARTLFFVRTKHGADRLAKQMRTRGVEAAAIHGNLNQNQRRRALDSFSAGTSRVLVATDVAARGIHVDDVDLVVHYDPPNDHKDYLHRSGRTARAGASGTVLSFVEPSQIADLRKMHQAADVTARQTSVRSGHPAVLELARSGDPVVRPSGRR